MDRPGPVRLVAIDGPGGAGKSTFAALLATAAGGAPVISTDDFASWDIPTGWWPRLFDQVIVPLLRGNPARYQRYDWDTRSLAEWRVVEPAPLVIIEGVSSGRSEWSDQLAFLIWIETPREVRLSRGLERDGTCARDQWESWMAAEDAHYAKDPTRGRADIEIDGTA
jgi:uridine kinase